MKVGESSPSVPVACRDTNLGWNDILEFSPGKEKILEFCPGKEIPGETAFVSWECTELV